MASYSSTQPRSVAGTQVEASPDNQDETSSLLSANEAEYDPESRGASSVHDPFDGRSRNSNAQAKHGRLAGLAGLSTGLGALVAVFALLRLPVLLAGRHDRDTDPEEGLDPTIRRGTRETYLIVAALALGVAVFLALGLRTDLPYAPSAKKGRRSAESTDLENSDIARHASSSAYGAVESSALPDARAARRERLKRRLARLSYAARARASIFELAHGAVYGFSLAGKNRRLPLAYFGGALARASTIGTSEYFHCLA